MAYSRKMYFQSLAEIFIGEVRYYMTVTLTVLTFGSKALSKLLFSFAVLTLLIANVSMELPNVKLKKKLLLKYKTSLSSL